jgi:hypothetical protein
MREFVILATFGFALVASTAVLPQSASACATWHCGCEDHSAALACRE